MPVSTCLTSRPQNLNQKGAGFQMVRHINSRLWDWLAGQVLRRVVANGFAAVQRLSSEWHANSFAGATVRKIARAILANAPILILDEATASLDSVSEALIRDALETLTPGRTTLVIAHRLSTVQRLDRILVFDHGHIVEQGSHADLLAREDGQYRRLCEAQTIDFLIGA